MDPVERRGPWTPGPCFVLTPFITLSTVFLRPSTLDVKILPVVMTVSNLVFKVSSLLRMSCNVPFAAEFSRGTKSPSWRANETLGYVKQSHQIWIVPVNNLLSSSAILYHVIAQLQRAHWEATLRVISKASIILSSSPRLSVMTSSTGEISSQRLLSLSSSGDNYLVSRSESLVLFFLLKCL